MTDNIYSWSGQTRLLYTLFIVYEVEQNDVAKIRLAKDSNKIEH